MAIPALSGMSASPVDPPLMPSPTAPPPTSPITQLSYDILLEIFTHCLPRHPRHRQPNTTIAPLLLCHICVSWRQLALASPTLWTHLSYKFTAIEVYYSTTSPSFWTVKFRGRNIEFIWWWKANHGQIPPLLTFNMDGSNCATVLQEPTNTNVAFQLDYIISAQYLELDTFFWDWLLEQQKAGHPLVFPHLHTARERHTTSGYTRLYELQTLLPPHAFPALRRVSLSKIRFPHDTATPPAYWTGLTHILLCFALTLPLWQTLLRALPQLRWGHFEMNPGAMPYSEILPAQCTLPALQTLSLVVLNRSVFPVHLLFAALHLPTLRTLSLSVPGATAWMEGRALPELYAVLGSTPGITKLVLEGQHISWEVHTDGPPPIPAPAIQAAETVWAHVPHLTHIQLTFPNGHTPPYARHGQVVAFVRCVFADNTWLDLQNAACPIRKVTISNGGAFIWAGELMKASVTEAALKVPSVLLGFAEESVVLAAADAWKEWGSRM